MSATAHSLSFLCANAAKYLPIQLTVKPREDGGKVIQASVRIEQYVEIDPIMFHPSVDINMKALKDFTRKEIAAQIVKTIWGCYVDAPDKAEKPVYRNTL